MSHGYWPVLILVFSMLFGGFVRAAEVRTETFDRDPNWDGLNNRSTAFEPRSIVQDFGYEASKKLGETPGAIGGAITPDGHPAYYAKPISTKTFDDALIASGVVLVEPGAGNTLLGFFNAETVNEWRTPNTIVFRINGRGETFHVHFEYCTSKWRAGAGVIGKVDAEADRVYPLEILSGGVHTWSLAYNPDADGAGGVVVATFDEHRAACGLSPGHRLDGAMFNRFGLLNVNKSADTVGVVWAGDLTVNGERIDLSGDPQWEGIRNRTTYITEEVRPRFNFGFSETNFAGGADPGEIGGLFFRGDCRERARLAYYGARLDTLTLEKPLHASGRLTLRRGVSDSTTLVGFFHAEHSVRVNESQKHGTPADFLGFAIEGPSSEGFFVYPSYRVHGEGTSSGYPESPPRIYPDGAAHTWTLDYAPATQTEPARITLSLDGAATAIVIPGDHLAEGAAFNRFGFVTPWIDGNGQRVYVDDVTYTVRQ